MKEYILGLVGAVALTAASAAQAQVAYDATPTVGFTYGTGNNYTPANAVVLTTASTAGGVTTSELALRAHVPLATATSTGGTGIYNFALGSAVSFDFSLFGAAIPGATLTITNLLTGDDASFGASFLGSTQVNGAFQGSQQLGFGFLNGSILPSEDINFISTQDNTFRIDLTGGGQTISAFARIGAGAVAAVPEPATWAMMLIGFGAMGVAMRRRRKVHGLMQVA